MQYLNGFNYADYLKRHLMVGQVDPWRITDEGKKIYTLLVSIEDALKECKEWSNQEIDRRKFINYLKLNDILAFRDVNEFAKIKEENEKRTKEERPIKKKRIVSEETKKILSERMKLLNSKKQQFEIPSVG